MLDIHSLLVPFAITLAIGFLIGAERESLRLHEKVTILAGLRTFLFVSIWGFVSAVLDLIGISHFFLISSIALVGFVGMAQYIRGIKEGITGLTTALALILTFLLGGLSLHLQPPLVLALGIITALILSFKNKFQYVLGIIPRDAVLATVQFAVLSAAILPFLPNSYIDPWNFLNPYTAWWIVVLISGVSFIGYLLHLIIGSRGSLILTAAVGGLISSTAVTSSMAQLSKSTKLSEKLLVTACVITTTIAAVRILFTTTAVNADMFQVLLIPAIVFVLIGSLFIYFWHRQSENQEELPSKLDGFDNPFRLPAALSFAILFIVIKFLARNSTAFLGSSGLYLTSLIAGLADIDAISLSISELLGQGSITILQAHFAALIAFMSNVAMKLGIIVVFAAPALRAYMWRYSLAILTSGTATALILSRFYFN
ncbi:MAG: MgtC/SapB family protein [Candidatus Abawacabacteria bacterium]|nr:MgtC/SapB family protein [Candidatus Abawacabacteria bacterium]